MDSHADLSTQFFNNSEISQKLLRLRLRRPIVGATSEWRTTTTLAGPPPGENVAMVNVNSK